MLADMGELALSEGASRCEVVARRAYTPLVADLFGLDLETFIQRAISGAFGASEYDVDDSAGRWWPWDRFQAFVAPC